MLVLKNDTICCEFDESSGKLIKVANADVAVVLDGIAFEFGRDEANAVGLLKYHSQLDNHTWNVPEIMPTGERVDVAPTACAHTEVAVSFTYNICNTEVVLDYNLCDGYVAVGARMKNVGDDAAYINTFAFVTTLCGNDVIFDFPCNSPIVDCCSSELAPYNVVSTGLVNFATHTKLQGGDFNLLFIDEVEKWSCGVYNDGRDTNYVYCPGVEVDLQPQQTIAIEKLYIQPCAKPINPYLQIRGLVERLGYMPCEGGITHGVMYSCHPSGTMDKNFPLKKDLYEYAEYLPKLKEMGIDHIWLLPVFDHNEDGVYHSNDQAIIDKRYGGEEGCKYYCDKAHELGLTVLFDYVPHGPAPEFPIAQDNPDWCSKKRDGSLQIEWECVSMDYNHPGYQAYTTELVYDHVRRFSLDGARIDCAMGGLTNWRPYANNRPSADSVKAGVNITKAVRDGFIKGGKPSFILPENFNPLPCYYGCTDIFYGMNLYRALVDLEHFFRDDPTEYTRLLTQFLEREKLTTPENYCKMRFLGNHDTVSWVWQSKRAVDIYTTDGAKALWAAISLIDGMPMIYQGDEDPQWYLSEGEVLYPYFKQLFTHRRELIGDSCKIEYVYTSSPVMAFIRGEGDDRKLVAVNLSKEPQKLDFSQYNAKSLISGSSDEIAAYAYDIFAI